MSADNMRELEIADFYEAAQRFNKNLHNFSKKNINIVGVTEGSALKKNFNFAFDQNGYYYVVDFYAEAPGEILKGLKGVLHAFILIIDTHNVKKLLTDEEKKLFYGLKWLDNVFKHKTKNFKVSDLMMPDFQGHFDELRSLIINGTEELVIPIDRLDFELSARWVDATKKIWSKEENKSQKKNFKDHICGENVSDTVLNMIKIIQKIDSSEKPKFQRSV